MGNTFSTVKVTCRKNRKYL